MPLSRWRVFDPDNSWVALAVVVFNPDAPGDTGFVAVRSEDEEVRNFLLLYLEDPLRQRPVTIEGLGSMEGPHSKNQEQFDRAMSALSHFYPSWGAEPA